MSELPKGWAWATIGELSACESNSMSDGPFGSNLKSEHYRASGVRVVRLGNIGVGQFVDDSKVFVGEDRMEALSKHQCFADDLVIAALAEPVGRCALVPVELGPAIVKADCIRMKPHALIDSRYLMQCLNSPEGLDRTAAASHGIGRLRINLGELREIDVPVAPHVEQRRIVAKLDELFARSKRTKEELVAIPALLERYRQSVLAAAFRGDLTADWRAKNPEVEPAGELLKRIRVERRRRWEEAELARLKAKGKAPMDEKWKEKYRDPYSVDAVELPPLPANWCWASVDEISGKITKGSSPNWQGFEYASDGIPFVRSQNVGWGVMDLSDVAHLHPSFNSKEPRSILVSGDVLLNIVGASIGRSAVAAEAVEGGNVNQAVAVIRPLDGVSGEYLKDWILSPLAQVRIHLEKVDVARANLSLDDVARMPVPLAPNAEATAIESLLKVLSNRAERFAGAVDLFDAEVGGLESSILTRAFRGELVPQDPSDEPASVLLDRIRAERAAAPAKKPGRKPRSPTP